MTRLLMIGVALALCLTASRAWASEVVDSGWVDIKASELQRSYDFERISYQDIEITESPAIQSSSLSVLALKFEATNKTENEMFFDLDVIAFDDAEEVLFVMNLSPDLFGLAAGSTGLLYRTRYVPTGTLSRVVTYRFRFIGFK